MKPSTKYFLIGGASVLVIIFAVVLYQFIKKFKMLDDKNFYKIVFSLILLLLFVMILLLIYLLLRDREGKDHKTIADYLKRMNELIKEIPTGEEIQWKLGNEVRYACKSFDDSIYIAMIGYGVETHQRTRVIYSVDKDDIYRFDGNAPPGVEVDIWRDFNPKHQNPWQFWADRDDRRSKVTSPATHIHLDKPSPDNMQPQGQK